MFSESVLTVVVIPWNVVWDNQHLPWFAVEAFSWCNGMEREGKKGFLEKGPL